MEAAQDTATTSQQTRRISTQEQITCVITKKQFDATWRRFAENVSISGLHELYNAPNAFLRCLWVVTLSLSAASILGHTFDLIQQFLERSPQFDVAHTSAQTIPFPDITVCTPADVNRTQLLKKIQIPPRTRAKLDKMDVKQVEDFLDQVLVFFYYGMQGMDELKITPAHPLFRDMRDIVKLTVDALAAKGWDDKAFLWCNDFVSNCTFNGKPYACCKDTGYFKQADSARCFEIPLESIDGFSGRVRHPNAPTSFTADLGIDWRHRLFFEELATDGFYLHVSEPITHFSKPVPIPGGTHVIVKISKATKRLDVQGCLAEADVPVLDIGKYDGHGYNCKMERFIKELIKKYIGCEINIGGYFPPYDKFCDGASAVALKIFFALGVDYGNSTMFDQKFRADARATFYDPNRCLPKCEAWEYEANPSYSLLVKNETDMAEANFTKSRVTVVLPSEFYEERTENEPASFYKTFYSIGYVLSLYAGFSMITFAEILFYSCEICRSRMRRRVSKVDVALVNLSAACAGPV